ncbi:MAG: methyltransferase [Acidimicrobiales bacterium]|nr:methyltransferase [Acidimicrobiales bacterium]
MTAAPESGPNPDHILQVGMGFFASKTLLSAVELELFTVVSGSGLTGEEIARRLGLHERSRYDFLDALVALGLLERTGSSGAEAVYSNTADATAFLDKASPAYLGGILEMANTRLYGFWGSLTEALRTGLPQNEIKTGAPGLFEGIYAEPELLRVFLDGMQGIQLGAFSALCASLELTSLRNFCDIGGANGTLSAMVATANPQLTGVSFDLPPVAPVAEANLARHGVADRVTTAVGDFFADDFPPADVYFMGNILHDWDEAQKRSLIEKAYAGLPSGGMLVAIENIIDDDRRTNAFGLLMSLNMLIELPGGFDYTGAQFDGWARAAGFDHTEVRHLAGPTSAAIAYKG